jgi:uncharacterized membrane protein (DUF485 family)
MTRTPVDHERNLHILNNPKYAQLTKSRNMFASILSLLMIFIYFGFIMLIAYGKEFLGTALYEGSVTTIGLPIGVGIIVSAIILTGIYVRRANGEFDDLNHQIIKEAHE